MNEQNLKPLSTEKAREIGAKGGKASVEARRKKRDLREQLEILNNIKIALRGINLS